MTAEEIMAAPREALEARMGALKLQEARALVLYSSTLRAFEAEVDCGSPINGLAVRKAQQGHIHAVNWLARIRAEGWAITMVLGWADA